MNDHVPLGATGVGSLPGRDPDEAMRQSTDDSLDLRYVAELPGRGPGADLIGRTAARLVDIPVELHPSGWRITRRPGIDLRRATDFWSWDLDAIERTADGLGEPLKIGVSGPWTLAASLELAGGHRVLTDAGAVRDTAASLTEGILTLLDELRARLPAAPLVLQLDEPSLPAVLAGSVPTASGFGRLDPVAEPVAEEALASLIGAVGVPVVVHCCAAAVPYRLLRRAGADAVLIDAQLLRESSYDDAGTALDEGLDLWLGLIDAGSAPTGSTIDAAAARGRSLARALGIPAHSLTDRFGVITSCGLAGSSSQQAQSQMKAVVAVARQLRDDPEGREDSA